MANWWSNYILQRSKALGLDPRAVHSVASVEGLSGAVGDAGTSFGPFQLHVGGALPSGRGRAWAESRAGLDYALNQIAGVAKGLRGQAAVNAIVRRFERPADPTGEVQRAMALYGQTPGTAVANVALPPVPRSRTVTQTLPAKPRVERWTESVFDPGKLAQGIFSSLAAGETPNVASLIPEAQSAQSFSRTLPGLPRQVTKRVPGQAPLAVGAGPGTPGAPGLVQTAAKQLGQPYVWGAESRAEGGFDCSGLIDWAARQRGYSGPRLTTYNIAQMGKSVKGQNLKPGDLVLSNGGEHVSIYAGNGKCLVSPHTGSTVQYQNLKSFSGITDVRRVKL